MAQIFGDIDTLETKGEHRVWDALKRLADIWIIYAKVRFVDPEGREHFPDYVLLHPEHGVVVLEVKDWRGRSPDRKYNKPHDHLTQVRNHAQALERALEKEPLLRNKKGKLDFPYRYAVVYPHKAPREIEEIRQKLGKYFLGGKDLATPERLEQILLDVPIPTRPWKRLSKEQIDATRNLLSNNELLVRDEQGHVKGVYDLQQEQLAKEPLAKEPRVNWSNRAQQLEMRLPEEVKLVYKSNNVRLVRGYAGTGKTDVLILRARHLHRRHPEMQILVTSFNKPLVEKRLRPAINAFIKDEKTGKDEAPITVKRFGQICWALYKQAYPEVDLHLQDSIIGIFNGRLMRRPSIKPLLEKYGVDFLEKEIQWLKEMRIREKENYLEKLRRGRGGAHGRRLTKSQRKEVWQVYQAYQEELRRLGMLDWQDLYNAALELVEEGQAKPERLYDAIMVDEAQHFAPGWIRLLLYHLKPNGHLFLCEDPSQGIYRYYSWLERGIEVRGYTRWLRVPYRTTRQIAKALFAMLEHNTELQRLLHDTGNYQPVDLTHPALREGTPPKICAFSTWREQRSFIIKQVKKLISEIGLLPKEIAIVHPDKHIREDNVLRQELPREVVFAHPNDQTGMEYSAVIVPQVQDYFKRNLAVSFEESQLRNLQTFFVASSRARDWLIITGKSIPNEIKPILPFSECIQLD